MVEQKIEEGLIWGGEELKKKGIYLDLKEGAGRGDLLLRKFKGGDQGRGGGGH